MPTTKQELRAKILEILEERVSMSVEEFLFEMRQITFSPRKLIEALAELEQEGILIFGANQTLHLNEHSIEAALV